MGKKGMERKFVCSVCKIRFAMEWAKNNHERLCKEKRGIKDEFKKDKSS